MRKKEANSEIALIGLLWLHDYSCTEEEYFTIVYLNLTKGNMFLCAKVLPCAIQSLCPFEKKKKRNNNDNNTSNNNNNKQTKKAEKTRLFATFRELKLQNGLFLAPDTYQETSEREKVLFTSCN